MRWFLVLICGAAAFAQRGNEPKASASEYPVHGRAGDTPVGAEYMVHSFSDGGEMYIASDHLVVEVALFPPKGKTIDLSHTKFSLRVNGKKQTIPAQAPQMAAASFKHPEWHQKPYPQADIGYGGRGVTLGGPTINEHPFPGAPPVSRLPRAPRSPDPPDRSGIEKEPKMPPEQLMVEVALPEGECRQSVSGFLYFPYTGKISSVKSVELLYEGISLSLK